MDWQALALTLRLATITTAILLVLSVPLSALLVARTRPLARDYRGPGSIAVSFAADRPRIFPSGSSRSADSRGSRDYFSSRSSSRIFILRTGRWLGHLQPPFAVQPLVAGFAAIEPALVDAARLLGANPMRIVFTLLVPLARRSLLAAAVLSFLHTVGEFGVVLMLGGDIPGATRTLSILLYNQVENFDYSAAIVPPRFSLLSALQH